MVDYRNVDFKKLPDDDKRTVCYVVIQALKRHPNSIGGGTPVRRSDGGWVEAGRCEDRSIHWSVTPRSGRSLSGFFLESDDLPYSEDDYLPQKRETIPLTPQQERDREYVLADARELCASFQDVLSLVCDHQYREPERLLQWSTRVDWLEGVIQTLKQFEASLLAQSLSCAGLEEIRTHCCGYREHGLIETVEGWNLQNTGKNTSAQKTGLFSRIWRMPA